MTLQEKLAAVQAEIANAKKMLEKRIHEAVAAFEEDTGMVVSSVSISADGDITVHTAASVEITVGPLRETVAVERTASGLL